MDGGVVKRGGIVELGEGKDGGLAVNDGDGDGGMWTKRRFWMWEGVNKHPSDVHLCPPYFRRGFALYFFPNLSFLSIMIIYSILVHLLCVTIGSKMRNIHTLFDYI